MSRSLVLAVALGLWMTNAQQVHKPELGAFSAKNKVNLMYVGNEGVILRAGNEAVAIDALHREYPGTPPYASLPPRELARVESAVAPYNGINTILVTHYHSDHFHPETAVRYLVANPRAMMFGTRQIRGVSQYSAKYTEVQERIKVIECAHGQRTKVAEASNEIVGLGLPHGADSQHVGFLVKLGGMVFLHVGDANLEGQDVRSLHLERDGIDVAFIPYWVVLDPNGRKRIEMFVKPKKIVGIHIPPDEAAHVLAELKRIGADGLTNLLETREYSSAPDQ